jgi:RNA polymerase sigma factor (sigma-70 family)
MSERLFHRLVKRLRTAGPGVGDLPTDGDLLDRYLRARDESAFELLVRRHGALVLGVCRRTLRDNHAAEDAFQATFLILARKASSVRQATVAGWLYRVALRVALRSRQSAARRSSREQPIINEPSVEEPDPFTGSELRAVLDDELRRLPERFRLPVLLCYVEGNTTEQAAQLLGCPRGTILSRLATARKRLSRRLLRRGVGVPAAGLAAALAEPAWPAAVPAANAAKTLHSVLSISGASSQAAHLAQGVIHAMFLSKLRWAVGVVLVLGVLGVTASLVVLDTPVQGQDRPRVAEAPNTVRPPERPRPEPQKDIQEQSAAARRDLEQRTEHLVVVERQHSRETLNLRLKLLALEEELRGIERTRDAELANHRRRIKLADQDPKSVFGGLPAEINQLTLQLDKLNAAEKPDTAMIERLQKALEKRRIQLANDADDLRRGEVLIEERYSVRTLPLRKEKLTLEEDLRLIERRASRGIAFAEAEISAAANRVSQLEGLPKLSGAVSRPNSELERQLAELLREVAELRKELKRQREGK